MIVSLGDEIDLTLSLTRNNQIWSGVGATVQVVRQSDGTEELAATPLVETSPGVYFYHWSSPPLEIVNLFARYFVDDKFYNDEPLEIISGFGGGGSGGTLQLVALVDDEEALEAIVDDTTELSGVIDDTEEMEAVVDDTTELAATVDDTKQLSGVVQDSN